MRRREFIGLLGGAAVAWPLAARAQQAAIPVVGFLHSASADTFREQLDAFRQGLRDSGYVEGENVAIEFRWAEGRFDRLPAMAADLVRQNVSVIAALGGNSSNLAAKASTDTIPVVFVSGSDPVKLGLVTSLSRPGGNITGISFFVADVVAKQLGLLRELVPGATTVALLLNPKSPEAQRQQPQAREAARALGLELRIHDASTSSEIDQAFATMVKDGDGALIIGADPFFGSRVRQIVGLATRHRIPAMYYRSEYAAAGGLISYGTSITEAYRQAARYVTRVLKGAKPSELPVLQPTKFELVINLRTAKALGLAIPSGVLAIADEVIE
jgi:putative tryptophan/tyrosine transport system substrate-binding protein